MQYTCIQIASNTSENERENIVVTDKNTPIIINLIHWSWRTVLKILDKIFQDGLYILL